MRFDTYDDAKFTFSFSGRKGGSDEHGVTKAGLLRLPLTEKILKDR